MSAGHQTAAPGRTAARARATPDRPIPAHEATAESLLHELGSDPTAGLSCEEAERRLERDGPNRLDRAPTVGPWRILGGQLASPILLLLLAAGILSAALGDVAEASVILVVVALNAGLGARQELGAARAMDALQAMAAPTVRVVRSGETAELPAQRVVSGDVVLLEAGSRVPADGRLLEARVLRIDESALTGESVPSEKHHAPVAAAAPLAERSCMAYAGTAVSGGRARLLVTETGMATELGTVADLLRGAGAGATPLQARLAALVRRLTAAAVVLVVVVAGLGVLRSEPTETLLLTAVSLAVAAVPESLPAVVTITLALGAQRMLSSRSLIRRLYAVETLGSVTTICSDKTGTLTQNQMTIVVLDAAGTRHDLGPDPPADDELELHPELELLLIASALCNDTAVGPDGDLLGDPTETSLIAVAARYGLTKHDLEHMFPRESELPFDADRKRMTTVHRRAEGATPETTSPLTPTEPLAWLHARTAPAGRMAFTKGAVDRLLPRCELVQHRGRVIPMDAGRRSQLVQASEALESSGLRVLGVACRVWPDGPGVPQDASLERGLTFVGLVGMIDPARPSARVAIATCRDAGIRAIMITGDHPLTACAIARDLGLVADEADVMTGADLLALDDEELEATVGSVAIYARVSPADKLRIVSALQRTGEVVAMTGDGVNDAPALKQADIGVAMGITGTDVTKDAADMVLLDDDFAAIVGAVREGRIVFDNIRKFIRNILSGNVAEVSAMVLAPIAGIPIPLLPLQILWLNLVTDGLPAMAMAVERPEPGVMARPPTPLRASLLGSDGGRRILTRGAALTALTLAPAFALWHAGDEAWQTVFFTSIAFAELAGGFSMRSESTPLWRLGVRSNHAMLAAVSLTVGLQVVLVALPAMRELLGLVALDSIHWCITIATALGYLGYVEGEKALASWLARRPRSASAR
ncbi:MAG: cation-translocating P-type ATPase [Solirubrobacteraceae bacterium]|nr:cation-translocating P-type ATPase [Solirubrobacteraceae bacterium]